MKFYTASMDAANNLLSARQQMKALKDHEKQLKEEFAEVICLDAIENPARVTHLAPYWRTTGLLAMEVENILSRYLQNVKNPAFACLKISEVQVLRRYAEFYDDGTPTGNIIKRTERSMVLINVGEVKPPRSGETPKPALLGSESLLKDARICQPTKCSYLKRDCKCPYDSDPDNKWKCAYNWEGVQDVINRILVETEKGWQE